MSGDPYAWLAVGVDDPDWWIQEASLFVFVHGVTADAVNARLKLGARPVDLSSDDDAARGFMVEGKALMDLGGGWSLLYEANGIPEYSAEILAKDESIDQVVSVFTNVNSVYEFAYWRSGVQRVRFEFPDQRFGSAPDSLLVAMRRTTGVSEADYEQAMGRGTYLARMMSLAATITSVYLPANFLQRRLLAAGLDDG